ncbi:hypothetical protein GGI15_001233 [Coemansia interrupta]|uniref:C2H2-type domain-containing protein n=1 Tax=Coemansia interrupta TaxID=1126814 RepID=A0A9W8HIT2_9FUNG|nr:hypothetical protein GGI15_001233 [Coemansia interrupta]
MCHSHSRNAVILRANAGPGSLAKPVCGAAQWMCLQCGYACVSEVEIYEHCRAFGHDFYDR